MASIDSLTFDLTGCSLRQESEYHRGWMNSANVAHMLRYYPGPPEWPFDLTNPEAATEFYRRQCADNGGVMLSLESITVAGVEALCGLFKYRAPVPGSLAMYYVGILWLPFQECNFQINIEAMEAGTTGVRETAVMIIAGDSWPMPEQEVIPVINSEEELQALYQSVRVRQLPSDAERYDQSFPRHPLSMVRARLADVIATLTFDANTRGLRPFRLRNR